jgi:hypothetical protein
MPSHYEKDKPKKKPKTLKIVEPKKKLNTEEAKPKKKVPRTLKIKEPEKPKPKKKMPKTLIIVEPKKKVPKTLRIKEPPKPEKKKKAFSKNEQVMFKGQPYIVMGTTHSDSGKTDRYDLKLIYKDSEHKTEFDHKKQIKHEKFLGFNHYIHRPENVQPDHRGVSVARLKKMKNPVKLGRIIKGDSGAFGFPKDFDIFKLADYKTITEKGPEYKYK